MNAVGLFIDHPAVGEICLRFGMNGLFSAERCLAVFMNAETLSENAGLTSSSSPVERRTAASNAEDALAEYMNAVVASAHAVGEFIHALFCAETSLCVGTDALDVFSYALSKLEDARGA